MKRFAIGLLLVPVLLAGCSSTNALTSLASNPLISSVTSATGLDPTKAIGGTGALLGLAQQKTSPEDWKTLSSAVPGTADIVKQANALGLNSSPTTMNGLSGYFTKLGLTQDQVTALVPAVGDGIEKIAGPTPAAIFRNAMK